MKDLHSIKLIAEKLLALSAELLTLIDADEQEYARFIESLKKTLRVRYLPFRA